MNILSRLWRHLTTTTAAGRRAFPPPSLKAIQDAIARGETLHRAEVRLIIEPALPLSAVLNGLSARARAVELFSDYRIWDTEENCGVLIYINLADHQVEIVAERAVGRLISAGHWQAICRRMTEGFARGAFHDSVIAALDQLHALLQEHFPEDGSGANQLPNQPILL
jgi:uncharacterized membrane protein